MLDLLNDTTTTHESIVDSLSAEKITNDLSHDNLSVLWEHLTTGGIELGKKILAAIVIYLVGRYLVKFINKLVMKMMNKRDIDATVKNFLASLVNIILQILLILSVVGALGIQMTSFAAILASAGVAVGMALSGNLQNFAGGVILLLFRPYKIGDYINVGGQEGVVKSIQIFNTILTTVDNKVIIIPNNSISTGVLTNYSKEETRRVDFTFGVEYGTDYKRVRDSLLRLIAADNRVLQTPEPFIGLGELADSSVNITVRLWVNSADYWGVYFDFRERVYTTFNEEGIGFPFPQITVHQAQN